MYKNSITHHIAKVLIDIMFYCGIVCIIAVPLLAKGLRNFYGYNDTVLLLFMVILFTSGICAVYILFNLKQMFKTLLGGNPFIDKNITCFRRMAVACVLIAGIYIIKCFLLFSWATVIIVLVFTIGTLFCLTLKDIFKQAIYYKEEHDWTV